MDRSKVHICTARIPKDAPQTNLLSSLSSSGSLAMPIETFWPNGKRLRVKFLRGGSQKVRNKVMFYAQQWEQYANIDFRFVESGPTDIRISFDWGEGSWSYIGTTNSRIPENEPTMNFGWFDNNTRDQEFSRTIIHEFGHALGCIHEHQSPNVTINWDKSKVYEYFAGPPNYWPPGDVDRNLFSKYDIATTRASAFDDRSIMLYFFPPELTTDGKGSSNNVILSPTDKEFIGMIYPFQTRSSGIWSTREARDWFPPVALNAKQILFNTEYLTKPQLALGLNELDIDEAHDVRVKIFADRVTTKDFIVRIDAWDDTALYSGGATWVEFDQNDSDYQVAVGTYKVVAPPSQTNSMHITFSSAYQEEPKIIVWLSSLNMSKERNIRIAAYADNIKPDGFDIHIDTWSDSILHGATATWIAYPSSKDGVTSGNDDTSHHRDWYPAQLNNGHKLTYNTLYDKVPKVYVAINRLDFDAARNVRFKAFASDETEKGFQWNVNSWSDSLCYGAGVGWIAFG
ncbi:zincin [Lojkania enalia]|uniref:Zincin n=1 Tax=Lojkania enalia TaxID=147567 RepID=A0A9P4K0X9_9PLEO|nr:zincin [Didymosphaeria enalia]